jgi:hypothetical protein
VTAICEINYFLDSCHNVKNQRREEGIMGENTEKGMHDLFKAQAETPMVLANDSFLSGNFAAPPEQGISEGETVIGELTDFEKALYTAADIVGDAHDHLLKRAKALGRLDTETQEALRQAKRSYDIMAYLLWASIEKRLGSRALGIRAGYKVVCVPESRERDFLSYFNEAIERVMKHDCEHCAVYEFCDLPQKKMKKE